MKSRAWVIDNHKLFNARLSRLMLMLEPINLVDSCDNPDAALAQNIDADNLNLIVADYIMHRFDIET